MGRYFKGPCLSLSWNLKPDEFNSVGSPAVLSFVTLDVSPKASTFGVRRNMQSSWFWFSLNFTEFICEVWRTQKSTQHIIKFYDIILASKFCFVFKSCGMIAWISLHPFCIALAQLQRQISSLTKYSPKVRLRFLFNTVLSWAYV